MKQFKRLAAGVLALIMLTTAASAAPAEIVMAPTVRSAGGEMVSQSRKQEAKYALAAESAVETSVEAAPEESGGNMAAADLADMQLMQTMLDRDENAALPEAPRAVNAKGESEDKAQIRLPAPGTYAEGRLLVKMNRDVSLFDESGSVFDELAENVEYLFPVQRHGDVALMSNEGADWYRVDLREGVSMLKAWRQLAGADSVLCVEPSYVVKAHKAAEITEYDPYRMTQQWHDQILSDEAWKLLNQSEETRKEVVVAILDSGVDLDHPDLKDNLLQGYDFVDDDRQADDEDGHGTHVAGIVAAAKNDIGVRGVAYDAKILPVRVLDEEGSGNTDDVIDGILWAAGGSVSGVPAADKRADVINLSLGNDSYSQAEADAVEFARSKGCLVVASAGNDAMPNDYAGDNYCGVYNYPAGYPGVLGVMASDPEPDDNGDWLASYSNYDADPGAGVEYGIMAPGSNVYSTAMGGGYCHMSGTSMASPVVAGAAAVLMSMGADADEVWDILISTTEEKQGKTQPDGTVQHYGELDLEAAVKMLNSGSTAGRKGPRLINPNIYATGSDPTIGNCTVDLKGSLSSYEAIYLYNNTMVYGLELELTNLGGSGSTTITGTIGGVSIYPQTVTAAPGEVVTVPLNLRSGNIRIQEDGVYTEIFVNGEMLLSWYLTVYELVPVSSLSGVTLSGYGSNRRGQVTREIEARGKFDRIVVYVQDVDLYVPVDWGLDFYTGNNEYYIYYCQAKGKQIITQRNSTENPEVRFESVTLLADGGSFQITGTGEAWVGLCRVWEPVITCGGNLWHSKFVSWTEENQIIAKDIFSCGLIGLSGSVTCDRLAYSMINNCAWITLQVNGTAMINTFVENYASDDSTSPLKLVIPDVLVEKVYEDDGYTASLYLKEGMSGAQIVGPMDMVNPYGSWAKANNIYVQMAWDDSITYDESVRFNKSSSTWTDDPDRWGYADVGYPLCVVSDGSDAINYPHYVDIIQNGNALEYTLTFCFGSPISEYGWAGLGSSTSAMADYADCSISNSRWMTARVCSLFGEEDVQYDTFYVSGPIGTTYDAYSRELVDGCFWPYATQLDGQMFCMSSSFYSTGLEQTEAEVVGGKAVLTWSDERIAYGDDAEIYRGVDGGSMEKIKTLTDAATGTYTDTTIQPGHIYSYEVRVLGSNTYYGYADCVYEKGGSGYVNNDINTAEKRITTRLKGPTEVSDDRLLEYTYPSFFAKYMEPCEELRDSGLSYGARDNGDGTVTVYIGGPGDWGILDDEPIYMLTPPEGAQLYWGENFTSSKVGGDLQLWNNVHDPLVVAAYNSSGRMLDCAVENDYMGISTVSGTADGVFRVFTLIDWKPVYEVQTIPVG